MEKHILSKIFLTAYRNLSTFNSHKGQSFYVNDYELLEAKLEKYILNVMGYSIYNRYNNYKLGRTSTFEYFGEISKYFENIIVNGKFKNFDELIDWISTYSEDFWSKINNYPYVSAFIKAAQRSLTREEHEAVITQKGGVYTITILSDRDDEQLPSITFENIERFEMVLERYISTVLTSDSFFNRPFFEAGDPNNPYAIEYVLEWTLKNATALELNQVEYFYRKYTNFLTDDTFNKFKNHPVKIGDLFGDELYLLMRKSTVAYETPYYFSFMLKNNRIELPNIRMGIDTYKGEKVAHILATQSSQDVKFYEREKEIAGLLKQLLPKSKNFREYNPSHLVSIVLALGFFNGSGIKDIVIPDYLPLRYQRFVLEERKSESELENYQYRLTNKFFYTFFKMLEVTNGIDVLSMPEMGMPLKLRLNDKIEFENEFLQNLYNIGYNNAFEYSINNEYLKKN